MIFFIGKWIERLKFIAVFLVLTFVLYHLLQFTSTWLMPWNKYKEPAGNAVKVFGNQHQPMENLNFVERLKFFYWYGE